MPTATTPPRERTEWRRPSDRSRERAVPESHRH